MSKSRAVLLLGCVLLAMAALSNDETSKAIERLESKFE